MKAAVTFLALLCLQIAVAEDKECAQRKENLYRKLPEQDFGLAFRPSDFLTMMSPFSHHFGSPFSMFRDYYRPWRHLAALTKDVGSTIKTDKDQFQINLDVQHFSPDEITVKTADGFVTIEARHEEKEDEHGFISRQFLRRYSLPEGTQPESIVSQLSSDGVLTISAPRKALENKNERIVPITQTGPVRKEESKNKNTGQCDGEVCVSDD